MSTNTPRPRLTLYPGLASLGVPYSKRQLARLEAEGRFPRRVPIGDKTTAWVTAEVIAHVDRWIAARDAEKTPDRARPRRNKARSAHMLGSDVLASAQS